MLTEANKAVLVHATQNSVEWRYPLSGSNQYDFNKSPFVYRKFEPVTKEFPAVEFEFLPRNGGIVRGLGDVIKDYSGALVYGYGELEPVIITVYTHQVCEGSAQTWHGKLVADAWIRRIERYIRRYWPKILQGMEAYIYKPMSYIVNDISEFLQGDERQGFELVMHLVTTNKWDYSDQDEYTGVEYTSGEPYTGVFDDAKIEMQGQTEYEASGAYDTYLSVSGYMQDQEWW